MTDIKPYSNIIRTLEYYRNKVKMLHGQIKRRLDDLNFKKKTLLKRGEYKLAKAYLEEMRLLTILGKAIYNLELGLLAVIERLDMLKMIFYALDGFKDTVKAVNDALDAAYLLPGNFDMLLKSLAESYFNLINSLKPPEANILINLENPEAEQIVQQVEREVGKIVNDMFPEVPENINILTSGKSRVEELLSALVADGAGDKADVKGMGCKLRFEDRVLYYIKKMGRGKLDVYGCAKYLNVPPQRVVEALYTLAEEGKIKFSS